MKFWIGAVVFVLGISTTVFGAETDVVRVFDENLKMTEQELKQYLKEANLEKYGFVRSEEKTTKKEDGKMITVKTIHYLVTDDCSRVMFWESVLEQRLPQIFIRKANIFLKTGKEVASRIKGRKTRECKVGLELHVNTKPCLLNKTGDENGKTKRGIRRNSCCNWWVCCSGCSLATISYAG